MLCNHAQETKKVAEFAVDKYPHAVAKLAAATYGRDLEKVGGVKMRMGGSAVHWLIDKGGGGGGGGTFFVVAGKQAGGGGGYFLKMFTTIYHIQKQ